MDGSTAKKNKLERREDSKTGENRYTKQGFGEYIFNRMAAITLLNPKAEFARAAQALAVNISAAKGIQDVMKTNLGPKGTMKM